MKTSGNCTVNHFTRKSKLTITNWKVLSKNTLRGFFSLTLASGLVIHKCTLHEKNGEKWIGLPAEKYTKQDGTTGYARLIEFATLEIADRFRDEVLAALEDQAQHEPPSRA